MAIKTIGLWGAVGLFGIFLLLVGFQEFVFTGRTWINIEQRTKGLERGLPAYLKAQNLYANFAPFLHGKPLRNAGSYLNPRVRWESSVYGVIYPEGTEEKERIAAPPSSLVRLDWTQSAKVRQEKLDLEWLSGLVDFDHWELFEAPEVQIHVGKLKSGKLAADTFFQKYPQPLYRDLVGWARIRLLQGMADKRLLRALKEVRQLARLLYSTETLKGELAAASVLIEEARARSYGIRIKLIRPGDWQAVPGDIKLLKKNLENSLGFYGIYSTVNLVQETVGMAEHRVGRCAAILEGMTLVARTWPYASGRSWPLERGSSELLESLRSLATRPDLGCRLPQVRLYWEDPSAFLHSDQMSAWWAVAEHLPYFRRVAMVLATNP